MNRLMSWLPNLRQILTVFLVAFAFWTVQVFGYSNLLQAQAKPLTPEATSYEVDATSTDEIQNDNKLVENARQDLKSTADNVREKLNLDQPLYPGTKEFLNDVQESAKDAIDTVTGNDESN